jgi:hypothetical protein
MLVGCWCFVVSRPASSERTVARSCSPCGRTILDVRWAQRPACSLLCWGEMQCSALSLRLHPHQSAEPFICSQPDQILCFRITRRRDSPRLRFDRGLTKTLERCRGSRGKEYARRLLQEVRISTLRRGRRTDEGRRQTKRRHVVSEAADNQLSPGNLRGLRRLLEVRTCRNTKHPIRKLCEEPFDDRYQSAPSNERREVFNYNILHQ